MGSLQYQHIEADPLEIHAPTVGAEYNVDLYQYEYSNIAKQAIYDLEDQINKLTDIDWSAVGFGASAGNVPNYGIEYRPPQDIPTWEYIYQNTPYDVIDPILNNVDPNIEGSHPGDFDEKALPINIPDVVDKLIATIPDKAPIVRNPDIPDFESDTTIPKPFIRDITFTSFTGIDIAEFTGSVPDISNLEAPTTSFDWTDEDYDSAILQAVKTRISEFLVGGVGIPNYVWDMIWNRGRNKEEAIGNKLINEVTEEFSAKGFFLPQGAQTSRIDEAHAKVQDSANTLNRELVIEQAKHEIDNMKYAIAQGQTLENMLGDWHQQAMSRALESAKYSVQAAIEIFNAEVQLVNAQVEIYKVQVEAYKIELETERLRLEEFRTYLEQAKVTGQLNQIEVDLFKTRWDAFRTEVEVYNAQLSSISMGIEIDKTRVEAYKSEVQAFSELVQAKTAEYQGYKAQWEGEIAKTNVFESQVKAYDTQVNTYKTEIEAEVAERNIQLTINEQQFKKFDTALSGYNAKLAGQVKELEARSAEFDAELKGYSVEVDNEKNKVSSAIKNKELGINYASQETQAAIITAQNKTNASTAEKDLMKNTAEIMSRAYSQLAAAAMSVVSVSAGISDGTSNSSSNSRSTSYNGGDV